MRSKVFFIAFMLLGIMSFATAVFETGKATYYANSLEGRKTSSGEKYSQILLTAAHKSLPFGTMVSVRNISNDSTVVVKVNDRLPQRSTSIIDLSLAAAKQLNFVRQGIAKVEITLEESKEEVNEGK